MFWTDSGRWPSIHSANMDGTNPATVVTTDLADPNGLDIDYDTGTAL